MADCAVSLEGVSKSFGSHLAVDDLGLEVPAGSIYGFIGPNGSGKTTTLRMILHIILADRGRIEVLGETGTRAANDRVGYLPEERGLYKNMTVRRQLAYAARLKGMRGPAVGAAVDSWLEQMGLSGWGRKKVDALSKGMKQKVQFIGSAIAAPDLLILDEPFSGLDPVNAEVIRASILELRRAGATVIFSTHDMATAEELCDSIFMIFKGRKVLDGTLAEIQEAYGEDTVRLRLAAGDPVREDLPGLPGTAALRDLGRYQELRYDGAPDALLHELVGRGARVEHFEVTTPSLHDIFIRIAGPEAAEAEAGAGAGGDVGGGEGPGGDPGAGPEPGPGGGGDGRG